MQLTSLASGSSGNCTLIQSQQTHLLIDAGISCKRIDLGLNQMDISCRDLSGVFITHEHSDHICGLKILSKKHHVPIYGTPETLDAIQAGDREHVIEPELFHPILPDQEIQVGDLQVMPFSNTHDAANPVGYRIYQGQKSAAVCTDLGNYSQYTVNHLLGVNALLLEANHDLHMLQAGPYPYSLKRRIMSDYGHLSNEACGKLLSELLHNGIKAVILGHLSKENNYSDLALESVKVEIDLSDTPYHSDDFPISVANRDNLSETITV